MKHRLLDRICLLAAVALVGVSATLARAEDKREDGKVEIKFELPTPVFAGTPKAIPPGVNIDPKVMGKKRPAWFAPAGISNLALKKKVTSSDDAPVVGELAQVTDGQKAGTEGNWVELGPGTQWVQIDLEKEQTIYGFLVWHQHQDPRVYRDVIVQVSNDPAFKKDVVTVFNNDNDNSSSLGAGKDFEYFEESVGKLVDCQGEKGEGVKARYVRLYSRGSTGDDQNHYTEVEVWGK